MTKFGNLYAFIFAVNCSRNSFMFVSVGIIY